MAAQVVSSSLSCLGVHGLSSCASRADKTFSRAAYQCQGTTLKAFPRLRCIASSKGESRVDLWRSVGRGAVTLATAVTLVLGSGNLPAFADDEFDVYYGTAASASSYGGYGGNSNKQDSAEYVYDFPTNWKERQISKVEKGTNGTDSEFYNPKKKTEKVYLTYLAGFRRLPPQENVLSNLALSDVNLQDQIGSADDIIQSERTDANGQTYYDFEIDSPVGHSLIAVTCTKNKLYSHFVNSPVSDWARDEAKLRHIHESFKTIGGPVGVPGQ
eukprot:jgi/Mesen1/3701/ME000202S02792